MSRDVKERKNTYISIRPITVLCRMMALPFSYGDETTSYEHWTVESDFLRAISNGTQECDDSH